MSVVLSMLSMLVMSRFSSVRGFFEEIPSITRIIIPPMGGLVGGEVRWVGGIPCSARGEGGGIRVKPNGRPSRGGDLGHIENVVSIVHFFGPIMVF